MSRIPLKYTNVGTVLKPGTFLPAVGATALVYVHDPNSTLWGGANVPVASTVYQSESAATTLVQPLVADSNGQLPGWVLGEHALDVVATYNNVAAPPALVEAVNATQLPISPMDNGATGGADDSAGIQAAINLAQTSTGEILIDRAYNLRAGLTYDTTKPFSMRFTTAGTLTWTIDLGIPAPAAPSATPVATGGTFAAATYFWRITALNANGEGIASAEVSAAIVLNGSCNLSWTAVTGATSYRVYRGTAAAGESVYYTLGNVTSFTDTNAATSGSAHPPLQGRVYGIQALGADPDGIYTRITGGKFVGPGGILSASVGTRPALMHGVQLRSKMQFDGNFFVSGFNAGITIAGHHQRIFGGASRGNYIGIYFEPDPGTNPQNAVAVGIGDQLVEGCELTNNGLCGVAVSPLTNPIYNIKHQRNHHGFQPVGIHIEAQPPGNTFDAIGASIFDNDFFEAIGNAMIYSESSNNNMTGVAFHECPGYWDASKKWASLTAGWNIYNVGNLQDLTLDISSAFQVIAPVAYRQGVIAAQTIDRIEWLNGQQVIDNLAGTTVPLLQALDAKNFYIYGSATHRVMWVDTSTLISDLMQANGLNGNTPYATRYVAAAVGAQAPILGVAAQAAPTGAFLQFIPVAISGRRLVRNVVATTAKQYLVPSTTDNGAVTSTTAPAGQVLGVALASAGTNSTTDALVNPTSSGGGGTSTGVSAPNTQSGTTYTLVLADQGFTLNFTNAGAITVTIPPNASVAFAVGTLINFVQSGTGQIAFAPGAGVTISSDGSLTHSAAQNSMQTLWQRALNDWVLSGDIS